MPEIQHIKHSIRELTEILDRISQNRDQLCENMITSGVAAGAYPGLAELEHVRTRAETLKHELATLKHKGKLDPEVRELESQLDQILTRYYWLWQKCRGNLP